MPHTTSQIAKHLGGQLKGRDDLTIESLEEISCAESGQMTFIGSAAYASRWQTSRASAAVISNGLNADPGHDRALIVVQDADLAMAEACGKGPLDSLSIVEVINPVLLVGGSTLAGLVTEGMIPHGVDLVGTFPDRCQQPRVIRTTPDSHLKMTRTEDPG